MTLRQYLTTIRVAGVREMPDDDESDREKMLLSIFLKGVNNRLAARATEIMKPKTLEEAYNFMKKEDKAQYSDKLRIINNDINTEKWQEMEVLKRKIIELEHRIKYLERNREINSPKFPAQKMKQEIKCFNCNGKGHIARSCNKPLVCTNCKKSGHISRFCKNAERPNFQKEAFRRCEETNDYSNIEYDEATCDDDKESEDNELFKIVFRKEKKSKIKKQFKRNVNYPADIIKLDEYIQIYRFTMYREQRRIISDTKKKPAAYANKPIVKGRVEREEEKIFIDSGAESTIMDLNLFQKIREKEGVKLFKSNKALKCANGSSIKVIGYSFINVTIGNKIERIKMTIVDKLFPRVIIGLRDMKKMNISILPKIDCVIVDDIKIPFISKIREQAEN